MWHSRKSGTFCPMCFFALIVLIQVVRDSIPGQKVKLLIGCMPAPTRTPLMCQSGRCSSVHPDSHAGTGVAVPSNMARESKHSLYDGPDGRCSLRTIILCNHTMALATVIPLLTLESPQGTAPQALTASTYCWRPDGRGSLRPTTVCNPVSSLIRLMPVPAQALPPMSGLRTLTTSAPQHCSCNEFRTQQPLVATSDLSTTASIGLHSWYAARAQHLERNLYGVLNEGAARRSCPHIIPLAENLPGSSQTGERIHRLSVKQTRPCNAYIPVTEVSAKPTQKGDAAHEPP